MGADTHIARLEERADNTDYKFDSMQTSLDDMALDIKQMAKDLGSIREALAEHRGANGIIRYAIHFAVGAGGVVAGYLGFKPH